MLVLSRRLDEEVVIEVPGLAVPLVIAVVRLNGGAVRLGIDAPREVLVHRGEVFDRILEERKAGA